MKRITTMVFAALVAVVLSVPAWAQTTQKSAPPAATNSQAKPAAKQSKEDKKEATKAKKAEKKAKKQTSKDAKKNTTPATK